MATPSQPAPWTPPRPLPGPIQTPRLILRFLEQKDAPSLQAALDQDRASFLPWLPWVGIDNRNPVECTYNIERFRRAREDSATPTDFVMAMIERSTGLVAGGTGFHRVNTSTRDADIGYWVRPDLRRQGVCTEAVRHMISWGFAAQPAGWGFRRLTIFCSAGNEASQRVPRKLGLRQEVNARQDRWVAGHLDDTLGWGVLADEWDQERHALRLA